MEKPASGPLLVSQHVTRIGLFLIAAIGISGGVLQLYLGQPETTVRLDNIHRFMAGIYLGCGFISLWAGITIARHNTLVYLLALGVFMGGIGRLISISIVGLPEPAELWIGYLIPELLLPITLVITQGITNRKVLKV
ncbi:MAG: DUF4345 domain-containing protein [Cyclobacteriaceae bacterium]|nr:DUF4345 domain-containing protein [Cyclobacteriaceae bacterium]